MASFADNFNYPDSGLAESSTNGVNWTDDGSGIDIVNGQVKITSTSSGTRGTWQTPTDSDDQQASILVFDIVNGGRGGVRLRVQGPDASLLADSAGYEFYFRDSSSTPTLRITKRDAADVETILASVAWDDVSDGAGVPVTLTGKVEGDVLTLSVEGVEKLRVTDTTFTTGRYVGLIARGLNSIVDDWTAKDVSNVDPVLAPQGATLVPFLWIGTPLTPIQGSFYYVGK